MKTMSGPPPLWRPYVMAGFEQRQFQSIQSNYAGVLVGIGSPLPDVWGLSIW